MTLEYDLDDKHYQIENVETFKKVENKFVYGIKTKNHNFEEISLKLLPDEVKNFHLWK